MTGVALASLDDLRAVVAELTDISRPLVVGRKEAVRLLDTSDTTFGRMVRAGHIRPVPHLTPPKYSVELLRRFANGDGQAFAHLGGAASGSDTADVSDELADGVRHTPGDGVVSPLRAPAQQGTGGPDRTARGGPTTPAA